LPNPESRWLRSITSPVRASRAHLRQVRRLQNLSISLHGACRDVSDSRAAINALFTMNTPFTMRTNP
jgi:hypothetical protein